MPRGCRWILFGVTLALGGGCQLLTGANERTPVSCEGAGCTCRPGQLRCVGVERQSCGVNGVYVEDLCPGDAPYCTGAGACAPCLTVSHCSHQESSCTRPACTANGCEVEPEPQGKVLALQVRGDCQRSVCDGNGNEVLEPFDDPPVDDNPCTLGRCTGSRPSFTLAPDGSSCSGGTCQGGACVGPCFNGQTDGEETGLDCGGNVCATRCDEDEKCRRGTDCASGFCSVCEDSFTCSACTADCANGTCGIPPLLVYNTRCYGVVVQRGSELIGSQSSPTLCEELDRKVRPRPGDVVYVYVRNSTDFNRALVTGTSTDIYPKEWYFRCLGSFQTPAQLAPELDPEGAFSRGDALGGTPAILQAYCPTAALYKFVIEP
jgi:hypothetical protein